MVKTNLCDNCCHSTVCKMKREFASCKAMADRIENMKHKDGSIRFPDFDIFVRCQKYQVGNLSFDEARDYIKSMSDGKETE